MAKTAAQREARKRRKLNAKEFRALGRSASDKMMTADTLVAESDAERMLARRILEELRSAHEKS
jgi:hypothetical protein